MVVEGQHKGRQRERKRALQTCSRTLQEESISWWGWADEFMGGDEGMDGRRGDRRRGSKYKYAK